MHKTSLGKSYAKACVGGLEGSNDCGLFAIAYATELAHGGDPAKVVYSQGEMRSHFIKCLENGILTPFPRELELVRTERPTTLTLDMI